MNDTIKPTHDAAHPSPANACSALHVDNGHLRRSYTRDELLSFCKTWMKANSEGCSREYYVQNLGLLVDFATDLFDGPNTASSVPGPSAVPDKLPCVVGGTITKEG